MSKTYRIKKRRFKRDIKEARREYIVAKQQGKLKVYSSVDEMFKDLDLDNIEEKQKNH